ncbi:MAG: signal peptidase I [Nocardioidaceae bacterium]
MTILRLPRPTRPPMRKIVLRVLGLAFLGVWVFFLWPTSLGGRTGYVVVQGTSMQPHLYTGDLVLTREQPSYHVGEVVAFHIDGGQVIHRLNSGSESAGFKTRGDNRTEADPWTIKDASIVGQEWIRIPGVGSLFARLHNPLTIVLVVLAMLVLGTKTTPPKRRQVDEGASEDSGDGEGSDPTEPADPMVGSATT